MTIPARLAKQIAGTCCYSGCTDPALDGSDYCGPHDAHERGRDANRKRRRRARLAKAGLCITGCGRKVVRKRRADGTIMQRRCKQCSKVLAQEARSRRSVTGGSRSVPGDASEADRVSREVEGDGYARTRYHGQPRRGQQPRHQLDDQDLVDAVDRIERARRGLVLWKEAKDAELPRIQLQEILNAAMAQAAHAKRFIAEVLERNRYDDRPDEMIESDGKTGR